MPAQRKPAPARDPVWRVRWGDQEWADDADDITAAEQYAISLLVGPGLDSMDVVNNYGALLALVAILHARDTGMNIGDAWIDLGGRPRLEIIGALSRD